ncbi:MAG: ATP-binding protein [Syntrophorhabdales bacterium]|jgi:hypothetical protein
MAVLTIIGEWVFGKVLDYGWNKARAKLRQPSLLEAFERACEKASKGRGTNIPSYTYESLSNSKDLPEKEDLFSRFEPYLQVGKLPQPQKIAEILMDIWQMRRTQLDSSEADDFFGMPEDQASQHFRTIAQHFIVEILMTDEIRNGLVIKILLSIYSRPEDFAFLTPMVEPDTGKIGKSFLRASTSLLSWPRTLGDNQWLDRPQLGVIIDRIESFQDSTTLILGPPGAGKSALLSKLAERLAQAGMPVLAIKADLLPGDVDDPGKLEGFLDLPFTAEKCLLTLSEHGKTVLIIDQLDAVSDLIDQKSGRLNLLLNLIQTVSSLKNVHVVCSSRPFEYRHDVRLNTLQADNLALGPLAWEQVEAILRDTVGIHERWSDDSQSLLRMPLHLKLFLSLRTRNPSIGLSSSLNGLLEELWQQRVLNREDSLERVAAIERISDRIALTEELWVPRSTVDDMRAAFEALEGEDILVTDDAGLRIGFRHQALFDFAQARAFSKGGARLSDYVLGHQDGLFVRPVLLRSLDYVRDSDVHTYTRELSALWDNTDLRHHLRSLLVEYMASRNDPSAVESACVLPLFEDETHIQRILIAMAGSKGWFKIVKEAKLPRLMSSSPETASLCVSLLVQALSFDSEGVIELIEGCWLPNQRYDSLTLTVLQYLRDWHRTSVALICMVAKRTENFNIPYIGDAVSKSKPELAPRIVRSDFDRRLKEARQEDKERPSLPPPQDDASIEEKTFYQLTKEAHKSLKALIENDMNWHDLSLIAESAPVAFLDEIWPWFLDVIASLLHDLNPYVREYQEDHSLGTTFHEGYRREHQPVNALKDAIEKLAETKADDFVGFLRYNENSPCMAVHRLLSQGLRRIAGRYPEVVLDYLTSDFRRLAIGDYSDSHRESCALISDLVPHLTGEGRGRLEKAILEWRGYYDPDETWSAKNKFDRSKWERQDRLRLLRAFPDNLLSPEAKKFRDQEERAFPRIADAESRITEFHEVGSPMSAEQMAKARDEDILNLFDELDDKTEWDHPRHKWNRDRFVGGTIQASRELGKFAEGHPERALTILQALAPGRQENPAGEIIQGLARSTFSHESIFAVIKDLNAKGFSSDSFRTDVARALQTRAERDNGLPDEMQDVMEDWLPDVSEPSRERVQDRREEREDDSILWGYRGFMTLPGGRDIILAAIAQGYLRREPPDIPAWGRVIERTLRYEEHPDVWIVTLRYIIFLFNGDRAVASDVLDRLIMRFPSVRDSVEGIVCIAKVLHLAPDQTLIRSWLIAIRGGDWNLGAQAFGELLLLYYFLQPDDNWVNEQIQKALQSNDLVAVHRGLAFAAALNWHTPRCRKISTRVIVELADSSDETVHIAISRLFRFDENIPLNNEMKEVISVIIRNPRLLLRCAEHLVSGVQYATAFEPDLISLICHRLLDIGVDEMRSAGRNLFGLAEPLVSMALTLHRMPTPRREIGLAIFERLIESNIQEARQALEMLDRKPFASLPARLTHRRRKARRRS